MNVRCPHCRTVFRVDPAKVPPQGVRARCSRCRETFRVEPPGAEDSGPAASPPAAAPAAEASTPAPAPEVAASTGGGALAPDDGGARAGAPASAGAPAGSAGGVPFFGPQDPESRARRIARALVSDMVVYHRERRDESLAAGTLRRDFRDEILKSWEEYVEQVGQEMAETTPFFRDALNDILAKGNKVF